MRNADAFVVSASRQMVSVMGPSAGEDTTRMLRKGEKSFARRGIEDDDLAGE